MEKFDSIEEIYEAINKCKRCNLYTSRIVPCKYRGSLHAKIMIIGEAFGRTEQESGLPFVGRAGQLLDKLLGEVGLDIEKDIYFTNVVHDRPPDNRDPFIDEIKACQLYIINEIRLINPKLIVTLGRVPGNWWNHYRPFNIYQYYPERKWFPVYHTAYLLRQPKTAQFIWKKALSSIIKEIEL